MCIYLKKFKIRCTQSRTQALYCSPRGLEYRPWYSLVTCLPESGRFLEMSLGRYSKYVLIIMIVNFISNFRCHTWIGVEIKQFNTPKLNYLSWCLRILTTAMFRILERFKRQEHEIVCTELLNIWQIATSTALLKPSYI